MALAVGSTSASKSKPAKRAALGACAALWLALPLSMPPAGAASLPESAPPPSSSRFT